MNGRPDIAETKSCGDCGLCCKLIGVQAIDKPQFVWCKAYRKGAGCTVYDDRPADCRAFICYWLHVPNLGDEWRPDRAGFVMHIADGGARLNIEVDPGKPQAWRQEPFLSAFRAWAAQGRARGLTLWVWIGRRALEITPDGEIDRGMLRPAAHTRRDSNKRLS
ncbi:YkgJ family cysteine cluster protein [Phenylobacterium aquaticum]|uniref:YkgJ family cysteine cluster protein n=1 Tax=Phenylobacterium aquaticum TaxID=1763816 RepID=UPI0026EF259E|nr:YkgJ family cysteine cluster protein [Phenylobacterium aquaticum]